MLIVHRLLRTSVAVRGTVGENKEKRYCAWNAFVGHAPKEPDLQDAILDGSGLQSLSAQWAKMSPEEQGVYKEIALAKQAQLNGQSDSGSEDLHGVPDASGDCPWSIGAGRDCPLSADLADTPTYSAGLQERVDEWTAPLNEPLQHVQDWLHFFKKEKTQNKQETKQKRTACRFREFLMTTVAATVLVLSRRGMPMLRLCCPVFGLRFRD